MYICFDYDLLFFHGGTSLFFPQYTFAVSHIVKNLVLNSPASFASLIFYRNGFKGARKLPTSIVEMNWPFA